MYITVLINNNKKVTAFENKPGKDIKKVAKAEKNYDVFSQFSKDIKNGKLRDVHNMREYTGVADCLSTKQVIDNLQIPDLNKENIIILQILHESHIGADTMERLAKSSFT